MRLSFRCSRVHQPDGLEIFNCPSVRMWPCSFDYESVWANHAGYRVNSMRRMNGCRKKRWISIMQTPATAITSIQLGSCQKTGCTRHKMLFCYATSLIKRYPSQTHCACVTAVTIRLSTGAFLRQLLSMRTHQGVCRATGPEWTVPTSASKPIRV